MVNRRTFVTATTLFPILTACGGGSTNLNTEAPITPVNPGTPNTAVSRFTSATNNGFLLDGKPFMMTAGELHPGRIPYQYWEHRIQMVKSMGFNTVSMYDFWAMHEKDFDPAVGPKFDFATAECNLALFIDLCKKNNMWVFIRPGPFVAAYWDLGGIAPYLLKHDSVDLRSSTDANYMDGVERYINAVAPIILPRLSNNGGPIIMVQVENEYTSVARDKNYVRAVRSLWQKYGIGVNGNVVFSTNNGITEGVVINKEWGLIDQPIGADPLKPGEAAIAYGLYHQPIFGSENYSGWDSLSTSSYMYGEEPINNAKNMAADIKSMLKDQTSFAIYVACGGTSFEYGASAGYYDIGSFTSDTNVTSYDYRGPINEQGSRAINLPDATGNVVDSSYDTAKAEFASALAVVGTSYSLKGPLDAVGAAASITAIPAAPAAYPMIALDAKDMPLTSFASIWDNLPKPITSVEALPCEKVGMYSGCGIMYQATMPVPMSGIQYLTIERLSDVATVFIDGRLVAVIDRRTKPGAPFGNADSFDKVSKARSLVKIDMGETPITPVIEIFVYTFGHSGGISGKIWDTMRKGMWGKVYIGPEPFPTTNFTAVTNWNIYPFPMASSDIAALKPISSKNLNRPGKFFSSTFNLTTVGDAYLDLSTWNLGAVWINGHNLGRHSASVGPQTRWYCPGVWMNAGSNQLVIFDNYITDATNMRVALLNTPSVYQNFFLANGKTYTITGVDSGMRLGTVKGATATGTLLAIGAPSGGTDQHWLATDKDGRWQLKNVNSGLFMDVPAGALAEGTLLDIATGNSADNQNFNLLARPDANSFGIKGQQSGLAVTDSVSGSPSKPAIALAIDYANPNQNWTFALA